MKSTPEPDVGCNKEEDELDTVAAVHNHNVSSDEEDNVVDQQLDDEVNNGYQLMPGGVNGQFYFDNHDDNDSSSSEDEDESDNEIEGDYQQLEHKTPEPPSVSPERDMNVNEELILSAMKNITLSSVPNWAENLSCERWDMIVKQAIKKDPATTNNTSAPASSKS